jgi:dolichyl-phosphate-mannose-protein mannosyltransferase
MLLIDVSWPFSLLFANPATNWIAGTRSRLYNSTGFFFLCWAAHYFPFYLMGRQLFLHHYLPAHLASALVTGALVEFIFNVDPVLDDDVAPAVAAKKDKLVAKVSNAVGERTRKHFQTAQERLRGQSMVATWVATGVVLSAVLYGFYFFFPLTYGWPGLTPDQVNARKWLGYDLHFAK